MLGWLKGIVGWVFSGVDDLWNKIVSVLQVMQSYVDGWIVQIIKDINSVYQWAWNLIQSVERFANTVYTVITTWATIQFNRIMAWVGGLWNQLYGYAQGILVWASKYIAQIYADISSWLSRLENWIIQDIWTPLYNLISGALRWIETSGAWVLYLLTHPDQLALILGRYILASWLNLGKKYSGILGRWLVHSMLNLSSDIAGVLEDIIAGIL